MSKHFLIVIAGATGIGKTDVSLNLAKHFDCSILNADSRQIYKELNIAVAKPPDSVLRQIPHKFINHISIVEPYSASNFETEAINMLDKIYQDSNIAILTGGTAFYIKAVLEGFDDIPDVDSSIIEELNALYNNEGIESLQTELQRNDPKYYATVDLQNPHRLIRALAVIRAYKKPFSSYLVGRKKERSFLPIKILLEREREDLYNRIDHRVDAMIKDGLIDEAKSLYPQKGLKSLQTVGYQELFDHFDGNIGLEEAINLIKRNSRRYAKRQMTWFRNRTDWTRFHPNKPDDILTYISKIILN